MKKTRRPKSKNYFTQETEDAIILYNKTEDPTLRSKIYGEVIHYPFFKLTQNIIHTFKFYNTDVDDLEHLQHEVIVFLLSKIHKYSHKQNLQDRFTKIIIKEFGEKYDKDFIEYVGDVDRVTQQQIDDFISTLNVGEECLEKLKKLTPPKAFSYFGTIAKRWLILYDKKNYSKKINKQPIDNLHHDINFSYDLESTNDLDLDPKTERLSKFTDIYVKYMEGEIDKLFKKPIDLEIAQSILDIFKSRSSLDMLEKKVIYAYLREMIPNVQTPKITKIAKTLGDIFRKEYTFYLENDYIDM